MAKTQDAPNLSQYFQNDPPSLFDEINDKGSSAEDASINSNIPQFCNEPDPMVLDEVKDMWEPAATEPGVPPLLTMPGVLSANDLADPIRDAVKQLLGDEESNQRRVLSADDVTQDERGLRQLISASCFRSAINLTSRLLTIYGQGYGRSGQPAKHTPHSLQLWFTRFSLLIKLRQFELCQSEAEPFGALDRPDLYYDFYPEMYSGRKGSMACFSFRLLLAEFPSHLGNVKAAMDRLTDLMAVCIEIKEYFEEFEEKYGKPAVQFWQRRENRVLHSLANCALQLKDFHLVDEILGKLFAKEGINLEYKRALMSARGRTALQRGDILGAEKTFAEAMKLKAPNGAPVLRDMVDRGLIAVAKNEFQEAYGLFQKGLALDPTNTMILNNMGGCLLYCGKLKDAIIIFESAVFKYPKRGLNERLILNLSTLYELESSNSWDKKLVILKQINRYKADLCVNLDSCLKLQTGC